MYEAEWRRRRRHRRRIVLLVAAVVLVCAAALGAFLLAGGRGAGAGASAGASAPDGSGGALAAASLAPSPSSDPVAVVTLGAVKVHRGETARLRYRIDDPQDRRWAARLRVLDGAGATVRTQGLGAAVSAGAVHTAVFTVRIPAGTYSYAVHVQDAEGSTEATSTTSRLTVLKALPPAFPTAGAVKKAIAWASHRDSKVGVAVVDSRGELHGWHEHVRFTGASLVKAMLLVAYLRKYPHAAGLDVTATKMIEESDNASAFAIQEAVGMSGVKKVARLAKMQDFEAAGTWIDSKVSAADQARFFFDYLSYVPASRRAFARKLLNGITPMQRWGIPAAAGPDGWTPYFKSGWLEMDNVLMVQAAWVEKGGVTWSAAVMTDRNPTKSYGWDTQKGFAGLLLGHEPTPAYLARVLE